MAHPVIAYFLYEFLHPSVSVTFIIFPLLKQALSARSGGVFAMEKMIPFLRPVQSKNITACLYCIRLLGWTFPT